MIKVFSTLLITLFLLSIPSIIVNAEECSFLNFDVWAKKHGQNHLLSAKESERELRKELFCNTKRIIEEHNTKKYDVGISTYYMRLNEFAANTLEEKKQLSGGTLSANNNVKKTTTTTTAKNTKPSHYGKSKNVSAIDWRLHGRVSSIKNQGQCGSCWAFSAIGAIEGAVSIQENFKWNTSDINEGYSVDQCLECTPGTFGCQGGYPWLCFDHIIKNGGIDSESDWPYLSDDCNAAKEKFEKVASILSYANITDGDEVGLRDALVMQPVSVSIDANCDAFMNYGGGILDEDCGGGEQRIDHSVLAVGYNITNPKEQYYIVKNSWGLGWGENGYVRMKIGENLDCIACKAVYPQPGPKPTKPPAPELKCAAGTYDPNSDATFCPKGSTCCCGKKKFWKPKECAETSCCLSGETCEDGKGCQKK